ncbi:hypothetical protein F5Y15DRAFT_238183 [Xylariaceae sp. FL0016]|nr:hypothetical protein F5Y15DRAFT_238183 [Xylariaceae sp. FL0016]
MALRSWFIGPPLLTPFPLARWNMSLVHAININAASLACEHSSIPVMIPSADLVLQRLLLLVEKYVSMRSRENIASILPVEGSS